MSDTKATLSIDGLEEPIELPVYSGTIGPDVVDVFFFVSFVSSVSFVRNLLLSVNPPADPRPPRAITTLTEEVFTKDTK